MTRPRYLVGDVHQRLAELDPESVDFVASSPPFLALRSYLPDSHPDKAREIGSERTPADFLDALLRWTAAVGRVLAPHGSIAVELGDTYSGSGGAGGDYSPDGLRAGQPVFRQEKARTVHHVDGRVDRAKATTDHNRSYTVPVRARDGWPASKSLAGIPFAYMLSLAYDRNVLRAPLTGAEVLDQLDQLRTSGLAVDVALDVVRGMVAEAGDGRSPAGRWLVRTVKAWIRSNPPVGALGDKERPATSYIIVATRDPDRWFDLDAVRTAHAPHTLRYDRSGAQYSNEGYEVAQRGDGGRIGSNGGNVAGAPPRDWVHTIDLVLDAELDRRARHPPTHQRLAKGTGSRPATGKTAAPGRGGGWSTRQEVENLPSDTQGARGVHLRRALQRAGLATTEEAYDVSPKGYSGAHYAVWPPELVRLLVDEMCPRRVCTTCGTPSRRITARPEALGRTSSVGHASSGLSRLPKADVGYRVPDNATVVTVGWSDCGHGTWRPGVVLDPFAGSGTTLMVATGMGRHAIGVDIDLRNAVQALARTGPLFLEVVWPDGDLTFPALPAGRGEAAYTEWSCLRDDVARWALTWLCAWATHAPRPAPTSGRARARTTPAELTGQLTLGGGDG